MKKKSLLTAFLAFAITCVTFAQSTPEVPRNYKPAPKELLPMPDSLTDEAIFPVLGSFNMTDKTGTSSQVTITRDAENKGIVWITGLPEGKFKAFLKASPATYKIPAQKALANDETGSTSMESTETTSATATTKSKSKVVTGRSIQEGTLIYDKDANTLHVNIGNKFNEENPTSVFPEMTAGADSSAVAMTTTEENTSKKAKKPAKHVIKSVTYTGSKTGGPAAPTTAAIKETTTTMN
ncbi:MAG: hypothetical protein J7539_14665 [Niabella sp.]|nr:hypothetical protein [Niabella sp.]